MASKVLDVYMKFIGLPYLRKTISKFIENVIEEDKNCEIDPEKSENTKRNMKNLENYCEVIVENIFNSHPQFPKYSCN